MESTEGIAVVANLKDFAIHLVLRITVHFPADTHLLFIFSTVPSTANPGRALYQGDLVVHHVISGTVNRVRQDPTMCHY